MVSSAVKIGSPGGGEGGGSGKTSWFSLKASIPDTIALVVCHM